MHHHHIVAMNELDEWMASSYVDRGSNATFTAALRDHVNVMVAWPRSAMWKGHYITWADSFTPSERVPPVVCLTTVSLSSCDVTTSLLLERTHFTRFRLLSQFPCLVQYRDDELYLLVGCRVQLSHGAQTTRLSLSVTCISLSDLTCITNLEI